MRSVETESKWAGHDPKSSVDLGICPGQCHVLDAELSGGIYYVQKLFRAVLPSQGNATRLHPLNRRKTQQTHAVGNDVSGGIVQSHTGFLQLRLTSHDLEVVV